MTLVLPARINDCLLGCALLVFGYLSVTWLGASAEAQESSGSSGSKASTLPDINAHMIQPSHEDVDASLHIRHGWWWWWSGFLTTAERLGTNLTEFWMSSSVTSTTVQCSSSRGNRSVPPWVTHWSIWTHKKQMSQRLTYRVQCLACVCFHGTLISESMILVSGFLSSILRIRVRSSSLIAGLQRKTQYKERVVLDPGCHIHLQSYIKWVQNQSFYDITDASRNNNWNLGLNNLEVGNKTMRKRLRTLREPQKHEGIQIIELCNNQCVLSHLGVN